jgi:hypothetical protein
VPLHPPFIQISEVVVDQKGVGYWPQMLGRLELWGIGGNNSKWLSTQNMPRLTWTGKEIMRALAGQRR